MLRGVKPCVWKGNDFILKGSDFLHQTIRPAKPLKAIVSSRLTLIHPKAYKADLSRERSGAIVVRRQTNSRIGYEQVVVCIRNE